LNVPLKGEHHKQEVMDQFTVDRQGGEEEEEEERYERNDKRDRITSFEFLIT